MSRWIERTAHYFVIKHKMDRLDLFAKAAVGLLALLVVAKWVAVILPEWQVLCKTGTVVCLSNWAVQKIAHRWLLGKIKAEIQKDEAERAG